MATLYSRLTSDEEVQDYHFLVDPIDHHRLTPDGFPQLKEDFPHSNINVHFNPITAEMSVSTMSSSLQVELQCLLLGKIRAAIATDPQMADILRVSPFLCWNALAAEVPHCITALYRSDLGVDTPSLVIQFSTFAAKQASKYTSKSAPAHIMTRCPDLQTMVRLDFGGLTMGKFVSREHHERHVQRIADLSSVLTWTRDEHGNLNRNAESLSKPNGELHLRLLDGNDNGGGGSCNVSGQDVEVVIKHSEILDVIRMVGRDAPLGGVPRNDHPATHQASVAPLPAFHYHGFACNLGVGTHVARMLGFGKKTATVTPATPATAATTAPAAFGLQGAAGAVGPRLHEANRAMAVVAPWKRILARLPRTL